MNSRKPLLITLIVLFGLVLIAAVISLIRGAAPGGEQFSGGEDSPYPYRWIEDENGSIVLTLKNGKTGYHWELSNLADELLEVSTTVRGGRTEAILTPINEGITSVSFDLVGEKDRLAAVTYQVDILEEEQILRIHFVDNAITLRQGNQTLVRDPDHPITVGTNEEGYLTIRVGGVSPEDMAFVDVDEDAPAEEIKLHRWEADSQDEMVATPQGSDFDEEGMVFYFGTQTAGETDILLTNGEFHRFLTVTSDGYSLTVTNSGQYEPEAEEPPPETTQTETAP